MPLIANEGLADCGARIDSDFLKSGGRTWLMLFDVDDDEQYVLGNCGVSVFAAHPSLANLYVLSVSVSGGEQCAADNGTQARQWSVQAEYGMLSRFGPGFVPGGPLAQPTRWSLTPYLVSEPAYQDYNGVPILNKAGDPFNPPLEIERQKFTLNVVRNEAAPDILGLLAMNNKLNVAAWNGFDAKTVKVLPIEIPQQEYDNETNQSFYPMKYSFDIDLETWKARVPNRGFRELKASKLVQIMGDDGEPVNDPVLLKNDGTKLTYPATAASIVILEFDLLDTTDFAAFGMDTLLS